MNKITWLDKIIEEMLSNEDSWDNIIGLPEDTLLIKEQHKWLDDDITDWKAIKESNKAVIWTETHIYFRCWENDTVVIKSIPRDPDPNFQLRYWGESN